MRREGHPLAEMRADLIHLDNNPALAASILVNQNEILIKKKTIQF